MGTSIPSHAESANFERPFVVSKNFLDTWNSVFWFFADAAWMFQMQHIGIFLMLPTIVTGLCLLYVEKRRNVTLINVAINCWICMNAAWMLADLHPGFPFLNVARGFFGVGLVNIVAATLVSGSLTETFSHFRRFRGLRRPML